MSYPGGKASVYQHIINQMPPHDTYIEPFLGGGAVLLNKRPARLNIGLDLDNDAIEQVRASIVNNDGASASLSLAMTAPHVVYSDDTGHNTINGDDCRNQPAHTITNDDGAVFTWLYTCDALKYLDGFNYSDTTLVYCDPPYLRSVRSCQRPMYANEFWTDSQHIQLLELIKQLPCHIIISGYWSELYADMLSVPNLALMWPQLTTDEERGGFLALVFLGNSLHVDELNNITISQIKPGYSVL